MDHHNFVKLWNKHCDKENDIWDEEKFVQLAETELIGRNESDILKHIKFYRTFLKLKRDQQRFVKNGQNIV